MHHRVLDPTSHLGCMKQRKPPCSACTSGTANASIFNSTHINLQTLKAKALPHGAPAACPGC